MGAFAIGTGERLRFDLAVLKAQFTLGADGGQRHLTNAIADLGFRDVVVWTNPATLPQDWPSRGSSVPLQWPEWPAWAEATWSEQGTAIKDEWGEMRMLHRYAAPSTSPTPASSSPTSPTPSPGAPSAPSEPGAWDGPAQAGAVAAGAQTTATKRAWVVAGGVVALCASLWVFVTKTER